MELSAEYVKVRFHRAECLPADYGPPAIFHGPYLPPAFAVVSLQSAG